MTQTTFTRRAVLGLSLAAALPAQAKPQSRFQLLLVERQGCAGCHAFLTELADYPQTEIGQAAPLLRVDLAKGNWPEGLVLSARPRLTPTFLLLDHGVERARILGYAGRAALLADLAQLLRENAAL